MAHSTAFVPAAPTIAAPIAETRRPRVKFPAGACDCRSHVFGPQPQYPFAPGSGCVSPEVSVDDCARMLPDEFLRNRTLAANPARLSDF